MLFRSLLFSLILVPFFGTAQPFDRLNFPVRLSATPLHNPWAGGINAPQLSEVDFNEDGVMDLYIFDRIGNKHSAYLQTGTNGQSEWTYAPQAVAAFPACSNWALLRDFNCDGVMDLAAHAFPEVQGIKIYLGKMENGMLTLDRVLFPEYDYNVLNFPLNTGNRGQIYVSNIDIPAIDDVDGDGDLDILTFEFSGSHIEWYRNYSVENGNGCSTFNFRLEDDCWGGIYESNFSEALSLAATIDDCAQGLIGDPGSENIHAGSTLLTFDGDNDGDLELVLGDLIYAKLTYLKNGGTPQNAWMTSQDVNYPSYDVSASIPNFPAAFMVDTNNDGKKDFIGASNNINSTPSVDVMWRYENIGTATNPLFEFRQRNFLTETMIDLGSGASPAIADINGDGLLDILVGNFGYYTGGSNVDGRLILFLNEGTAQAPKFYLADDNYLNFKQYNALTSTYAPAFGDLDGDGDLDLLVGEEYGALFYAQNTAGPNQPMAFAPIVAQYKGIDVGLVSVPAIFDINKDGLKDIIIGEKNGNINYFQNIGTANNPQFNALQDEAPNTGNLGFIDPTQLGSITGYSAPTILSFQDSFWLATGSESGYIELYNNIDQNINSLAPILEERLGSVRDGLRTRPAFADLNGDGFFDMVVGNFRGGLTLYSTNITTTGEVSATNDVLPSTAMSIFPNPSQGSIRIEGLDAFANAQLSIWDATGKSMLEKAIQSGERISTATFAKGLYFVRVQLENGRYWTGKFLEIR